LIFKLRKHDHFGKLGHTLAFICIGEHFQKRIKEMLGLGKAIRGFESPHFVLDNLSVPFISYEVLAYWPNNIKPTIWDLLMYIYRSRKAILC
jgi:hypothetical protein